MLNNNKYIIQNKFSTPLTPFTKFHRTRTLIKPTIRLNSSLSSGASWLFVPKPINRVNLEHRRLCRTDQLCCFRTLWIHSVS